jgi:uncharacterized protein YgfB (UPF0149 family)
MSEPEYHEIERRLAASRALTDLPEAHGTLAGALCATHAVSLQDWLREVFADGVAGEAESTMHALFEWTRHVLTAGQLEFRLMLPGDETAVAERATALGQWCQGFLYGLGSSPLPDVEQLPAEVAEIVRDLTALTQMSIDADEPLEESEQAYAELVEFVRIGVQLLHEELARFRDQGVSNETDDAPRLLH